MPTVTTYFKQKTARDPKYCAWIRKQPCLACRSPKSQHHHEPLNGRGIGLKGPDNEAVPLCQRCHSERHRVGRETFYQIYGINWRHNVKLYQKRYRVEHGQDGRVKQ